MADRLNLRVPAALVLVLGLLLAIAMPVAAAPQGAAGGGTVRAGLAAGTCGNVTDFNFTSGTAGTITFNGTTSPIAADATVAGGLAAALDVATSTAPVVACLSLTMTGSDVTTIAVAGSVELCGTVTATGTGAGRVFTVGGVAIPAAVTADASLTALLNAAVAAEAEVCLDVTADGTTGAITAVANLTASFTLCGEVTATADAYAIEGLVLPAGQLSAAEMAALELALQNDATACVDLDIEDTTIVSATATVDVCVTASAVSATSVTLDGVEIPLGEGATVDAGVTAGATLGIRLTVDATTGAVTIDEITLAGCGESGEEGAGGGQLPDTSTSGAPGATVAFGLIALSAAGAAFVLRREDRAV